MGIDEAFKEAKWPEEVTFKVEQDDGEIVAIEMNGIEPANLALKYCRLLAERNDTSVALLHKIGARIPCTCGGGDGHSCLSCRASDEAGEIDMLLADLTKALGEMK